jgi:hypothetical protein
MSVKAAGSPLTPNKRVPPYIDTRRLGVRYRPLWLKRVA